MSVQVISKIAGGDPPSEKPSYKRVYYNGTDTLKNGYAMCYQRAYGTAANEEWNRASWVAKPATTNMMNFAGLIVGLQGTGKAGPGIFKIVDKSKRQLGIGYGIAAINMGDSLGIREEDGAVGYQLWPHVGTEVATARQTTTEAGELLVEIESSPVTPMTAPYGTAAGVGPSPGIWESCPWLRMLLNPTLGYTFFDDFISAPVMASATPQGPYLTYQDSGVTIQPLETKDELGGVIEVANNGTLDYEGHIGVGSSAHFNLMKILSSAPKGCWFEARLKKATVVNNGLALFVGVGEEGMIAENALVDSTGEVANKDFIGAQVLNADGDSLLPCYKKLGQTKQTGTAVAIALDTYFKVGFAFLPNAAGDNGTLTIYINGVSKKSVTDVSVATFPDGELMTPMLLSKVGTGAAEVAAHMDWWRFAQLR